jgi:lipoate---protein ligase
VGETWRYVDCGSVDAFENQAVMAVLVHSSVTEGRPTLQTSVWGATHLNVGWFDDVDATTDLEACRRLGIQVVRRPMAGGGTAFYDKDCSVMWGLLRPSAETGSLDDELARFAPIVLDALGRLGLGEVGFAGSADLRWRDDRKLGGMSANDFGPITSVGGFLNVKPPDVDLYLQVARIPDEKFRDKAVRDLREYVCTAEEVAGHPVSYDDFRDALVTAVRDAGITLETEHLTEVERDALGTISLKTASDDALRRVSSERFRARHLGRRIGFGNFKGRKLCRAGVALDDAEVVVAAMMAGDMHVAPPDTLDRVANALVGVDSTDIVALRAAVSSVFDADDVHQADTTTGVTTEDLVRAIERAVTHAMEAA